MRPPRGPGSVDRRAPEAPGEAASRALHERVQAFIGVALATEGREAEAFDALALDLARHQATRIPALARLASARGVDLSAARAAAAIPAVPCDLFRLMRVATHATREDRVVFRTSGTSQGPGARGEHAFRTTATYERAALAWGARLLWPGPACRLRTLVLAPSLAEAPDSSLGFMLDLFARAHDGAASVHVRGGALDVAGVATAAAEAAAAAEPALVLGTSFAFVHLLESALATRAPDGFRLPAGSRVMQTGGFKGRAREVPAEELRARIAALFGVPVRHVVSEYGMTELSSQLYEGTLAAALGAPAESDLPGRYVAPPWVRVTAVDPATLEPLAAGSVGLARIVDLANVDSAVAVQTADRVRVEAREEALGEPGGRVIELLGRAAGAPPRGCSLALDALLSGA